MDDGREYVLVVTATGTKRLTRRHRRQFPLPEFLSYT